MKTYTDVTRRQLVLKTPLMDGKSSTGPDVAGTPLESSLNTNKSVPRGLLYRELGFKQKCSSVSLEFQRAAEDRLVLKYHEELPCELPEVPRSTFLMVFSPDGTKVASTHGNHNIHVTDLNTGKNVNTLSGHPRTPWCIAFHPSSNQILASGCLGGQVRVWDLHGGSEIWTAESQTVIASLAFHPTDRMLVIATYNELHFWDWSQPIPFTKCYTSNQREKVRYVAFDPLGHKLITGISNAPHNQSQWDRVANPSRRESSLASTSHSSHPRSVMPADQERRITVCYRSLVEQYEQLVQRYYDLSRSRTPTMDRGTDPMDLSESAQPAPQSGTSGAQSQSPQAVRIHVRGMRFLMRDDSSSSNEDSASRRATGGTRLRRFPAVNLDSVSNMLRRRARQTAAALGTVDSVSEHDNTEHRTERHDFAQSASTPTRRFEFDNVNIEGPEMLQESGEQGFNQEHNSVSHASDMQQHLYSAADSARRRRRRRRSLDGERQITPNSITRDVSNHPIVTESSPSSERLGVFPGLQSETVPSSPCPPERPHRFFVSQRSAFQPRIPRGDQHARSGSGLAARPPSGVQAARSGYFLHRRLSGAYHSQNFQDDTEESSQGLDSTSDVGVRYGIQLLSRHIDSMQRLCRARLEILQLQQIRRMWEDLQRQIRSLHAAVRDSTFALTARQDTPVGPNRHRFRLHAVSGEDSGLGMSRQNCQRSGDSEPHATEPGPHIPSVSQMLELARISDIGPSVSCEHPASTSGANLTRGLPVTPGEQDVLNQDSARSDRLAQLHAQFKALTALKLVTAERNSAKEEGECSRNKEDITSRKISATNGSTAQPVSAASDRVVACDGEPSLPQSIKPICFGDPKDTAADGPSSRPDSAGRIAGIRTSGMDCKSNTPKTENVKNSPRTSSTSGECNETGSLCKKKRGPIESKSRSANVDLLHDIQASSSVSASDHDLCASSTGGTPSIPTITTTTATTATTVTSSSAMNPSNSSVPNESPEATGHQASNSWCRYAAASASASSAANSQHQRLWRITHRVYMRKPRLLAMGFRSRAITRQPGSNSTSSHRNYAASIFRHHESGGRPWFMQSAPSRSQHTRMPSRDTRTSAQVGTHDSRQANFAAAGASSSLKEADGDPAAPSSDMSSQVVSGQSSSQSAKKPKLDTSSESNAQPGPSRWPEEKTASSVHSTSSHETAGVSSATMAHGAKRRVNSRTGPSSDPGNSQQTSTTSESLSAMIARLESLVRQQREQRESLHRERRGQQSNMWELRDRHLWFRAGANSGSDSDSNPESDRHQPCGQPSAEGRLITAIQNETNRSFTCGSHHGHSGALDEDWEWTRESTRLRARQVLSLMVESLTQFFEENGLPNSTSHAVLDEQMYNLYILLQLALELTDLLLAQLVSTRRELEHQWVHRLRSPVALGATTAAGQHQSRRMPFMHEVQDTQRSWQAYSRPEHLDVPRLSPYRRLLRYREHPYSETDLLAELDSVSAPSTRGRSNPRRLGSRTVNCFSRHGSHTGIAAASRICRGGSGRPLVRGVTPRRDSIGVRSLSCFRDGGIHVRPYTRTAEIRSQSYTARNTGPHLLTSEEPGAAYAPEIRSPNFMVGAGNTVPAVAVPTSVNQQNNDQQQQQQQQQDAFTVPLVRVNDVPITDTSILSQPQPQQRPQSPPSRHPSPHLRNPFIQQQSQQAQSPLRYLGDSWRYPVSPGEGSWRSGWRPRFLHPRYVAAPNPFGDDQDEPLIGPFMENINIIRDSFIITDAPMSPNHRLQAWDFSRLSIPDISNADKNVVVAECKIHNDASVDVSNDGRLLVTLLPTGRLGTAMLGVYSMEWNSLGQCLYIASFEQNAVSVSLSPTSRHLLVGLASRRVALLPTDQHTMAQIFRLEGGLPGRPIGARGRLSHIRDIVQDREQGYMSLNCIRWAPGPGQGLVYGTNTGKLKLLR
ncbi:hypothetical protein B7P43_G12139 [Cryptotermes secundus]|uniref:Uncharacterized protein n=1 Tax=Cryptotermes secundus TaxID=105785 RepID=A0A2J7R2H8_9NEOP|nr:uncharacterized protein LOC111863803 isoform X3 [Cryptotermes secundus]PNF35022.1 hypothetical protein B7P43_G12139 [Cryptotermes secundus]